ncbi:MAG TPA: DUF3667 domain-containing protein [Terricaulis sp.]|nr:DUF3667 domain-containing protein [Terricaulis sp.]
MSGELEAAGALATAGLVAGAIEGREPGEAIEGACLNCGAKIDGRYCSNCGQSAHPHRTLFGVLEEFLHGVLHFDTKAWRTLPMVIFRPGTLTRNWVYGKRARYISPLALFLFTVFFMFFAFAFIEAPVGLSGTPEEQRAEAVRELAQAREELATAESELAEARVAPAPTDGTPADLGVRMAELEVRLAQDEVERREAAITRIDDLITERLVEVTGDTEASTEAAPDAQAPASTETPAADGAEAPVESNATPDGEYRGSGALIRDGETWKDGLARAAREGRVNILPQFPEWNARMVKKLENPDLALYKVQQTGYKFSFLLVPISLPFIALLFLWKRGVTFYDHVVYALYALSFASILFVAIIFLAKSSFTAWIIPWLLCVAFPVHTFFHIGGAYKLGVWSALWRTFFMLTFATVALSFFIIAIFVLGLGTS